MTARDIAQALINRVRSLQEFVVETELPEDFAIRGYIPFHITIRDGVLTARVMAVSAEDAQHMVQRFLESQP
jgi:hypothetical protein